MSDTIKASVFRKEGRKFLYMQYRDPDSGDKVCKSTKQIKRREAERVAAKWETEVNEGREQKRFGRMPWPEFRRLYEDEVLPGLAERTDEKVCGVFNVLERLAKPSRLCDLNEAKLSAYQSSLRKLGRAETTIKGHLAHIKAALNWAVDQGMLNEVPAIKAPKRAKGSKMMKGRPVTGVRKAVRQGEQSLVQAT